MIVLACSCDREEATPPESSIVLAKNPHLSVVHPEFSSEEHWMVSRIVADLASMARLAGADGPAVGAEVVETSPHHFTVGDTELALSPSAWDPASYLVLLEGISAESDASTPTPILPELLDTGHDTLQSLNARISEQLAHHPRSAAPHQQAALLLGAWGLRESASWLTDLRPLLCRMTAHLAMAEALRGEHPPGPEGIWAEILLDLHAGRRVLAREKIESMDLQDETARRWHRVVDLSIRKDWRDGEDTDELTLLEALAQLRALRIHVGEARAMTLLENQEVLHDGSDWTRLFLAEGPSVEMGHRCLEVALPLEIQEIGLVFPLEDGDEFATQLASQLNAGSPGGLVDADGNVRVIHDGDWGYYFRRHLFEACYRLNRFLLLGWGVEEAAVEWEGQLRPLLSALDGYELVAPRFSTTQHQFHERLERVPDAIRQHLTTTPACLWFHYRFPILEFTASVPMPGQFTWFRDPSPPGTAYNASQRIYNEPMGNSESSWKNGLERFAAHDPWNAEVAYQRSRHGIPPDEAYASIGDYSIRALRALRDHQSENPELLVETLGKMQALDPRYGTYHGELLAAIGRTTEAAEAMADAFREADDRVAISNRSRWLIHHYRVSGEPTRAEEVATHNAEVYSKSGLVSAMAFAADEEDGARVRELAEAVAERYGDRAYLGLADWAVDGKTDTPAIREVFPEGIRTTSLVELEDKRERAGVRILESTPLLLTTPLEAGDVMLAIDDVRIHDNPQYFFMMDATLDPEVGIVVLRGEGEAASYHQLTVTLPDRRFGGSIEATAD